jgi:hypothetical protein
MDLKIYKKYSLASGFLFFVISISVYFDLKHGKSSLDNSNLSTQLTVCSRCHTHWQEGRLQANVTVRYRKELVLKPDV